MTEPRDPRDYRPDEIESLLRQSLQRNAMKAPDGELLAERIIHAAGRAADGTPGRARPRRTFGWAVPLTVAAVVLVVAGVVLAITNLGSSNGHPTADRGTVSGHQSISPTPSLTTPPSTTPAPSRHTSSSTTTSPATNGPVRLSGVKIVDLTFDSQDSGWALATADCLTSSGRCTALLHTDDGSTWQSRPGATFNVPGDSNGCSTACVEHIRFATADVGYAFGPSAFFMTTDGGKTWEHEAGGADALETANETVIRVSTTTQGCPPGCTYDVQTSGIGSTSWTTASIHPSGVDVALTLGGSDAYLLVTQHTTGGAGSAQSTLYRSGDLGKTWHQSAEPCAQYDGEVDSTSITAGPTGSVAVLCVPRQQPVHDVRVSVSTNEGASFHLAAGGVPSSVGEGMIVGDPASAFAVAGTGLAISTNGGRSWSVSAQVTGTVRFAGFESDVVGRAVTGDDTVWTTRDGGTSWTPVHPA